MRIDQHLEPATIGINARQHFFLSAWFNLVHEHSVDSYRVRVMNPLNILREFQRMSEPPANEKDRKVVADEAFEVFLGHPVTSANPTHYPALTNALALISEPEQTKESGIKKTPLLLKSFIKELDLSLKTHFLQDCFAWMERSLSQIPQVESPEEREAIYSQIQRVCRDILSVAHDEGFSLESLFHLYRHLADGESGNKDSNKSPPDAVPETEDLGAQVAQVTAKYSFVERFSRVKNEILAEPKEHHVIFVISGAPTSKTTGVCGRFGSITISEENPGLPGEVPRKIADQFSKARSRLFASAVVASRDGRSAGLGTYRQIGQILDLMRFEYDTPNISVATRFVLIDGDKSRFINLPQLIPNPESEPPTRSLEEFVAHLDDLATRDSSQTESRDRMFSAFRLYRIGTSASMFENKLVNWWTGIEYLTNGMRADGGIWQAVKNSLAPTLALTYLSKHLTAFRSALSDLDGQIVINGAATKVKDCSNTDLYRALKDAAQRPALETLCKGSPYLWNHLLMFIENISTPAKTAAMLKAHDQRVRWQIERIYRARCDIVHAGGQVVMASLLCANLEFYLRMTLKAMLKVFASVPTLTGPAEFFERQRHQFAQVLQALESADKKLPPSDAPLVATLN